MYLLTCGIKYKHINDICGVLEAVKAEFYRRVAAPYEDLKIKENKDVIEPEAIRQYIEKKAKANDL